MKLTTVNYWLAADYINKMFPRVSDEPCPDHGPYYDDQRMVTGGSMQENMPGRITFRVPRSRFMSSDTLGCVLKRMLPVLGLSYVRTCTQDTETYAWQTTPTRCIVIWRKRGAGTFIQLRDDAPSTGVEA